jgi:hypothetical protein
MKYALVFPDHRGTPKGPIPRSLFALTEKLGIDRLFLTNGANWDEYDALLYFHNRKPNIKAKSAKVGWWLCDLRVPEQVASLSLKDTVLTEEDTEGKLDHIFLCNRLLTEEYAEFYGAEAHYLPQCGNDLPVVTGRQLTGNTVFIGAVPGIPREHRAEGAWKTLPPAPLHRFLDAAGNFRPFSREEVRRKEYHGNRLPLLLQLQQCLDIDLIAKEGTTLDTKWLYQNAPISLAISPPATGYTSNRLYNILSSKGFCLTMWFPGIEEIFENHKHLVWFRTPEEAVDLAKFYLARPEDRMQIQEAGYQEYTEKHTAAHRIDSMLKIMSQ